MFIVIEGPDGCGKGTQSKKLRDYLVGKGYEVVVTREPGGTQGGEIIRERLWLHPDVDLDPDTQLLLFYSSRMELNRKVVEPNLREGKVVLTDRYDFSTYAYQVCAQNSNRELFGYLSKSVRRPDLVIILDVDDVSDSLGRAKGVSGQPDWFENKNLEFHMKVREGYRQAPEVFNDNIHIVSFGSIDDVWGRVKRIVDEYLIHSP